MEKTTAAEIETRMKLGDKRMSPQQERARIDALCATGRKAQNAIGRNNGRYQQQQEKAQEGFLKDWREERARRRSPEFKGQIVANIRREQEEKARIAAQEADQGEKIAAFEDKIRKSGK